MSQPELQQGYYRHFKGGIYRVAGLARDCDSQRWMVYYQCCYGDWSYWLRPLENFCETVQRDNITQARFEFIGTQLPSELEGERGGV